jgi:membrane associated rhomboid family serine protease
MANHPYRTVIALIAAAALVFVGELAIGDFGLDFGAIPVSIRDAWNALKNGRFDLAVAKDLSRLVTAIFLHANAEHLLLNMVFLWTFGALVTRHLGPWVLLSSVFLCGVCGNILQTCLNPNSPIPIVGASGAISGLGAIYLGLALRWQLPWPDIWPISHPIPPLQLGAVAIIGAAMDMYMVNDRTAHIAFGAHLGGFFSGLAIAGLITTLYPTIQSYRRPRRQRR